MPFLGYVDIRKCTSCSERVTQRRQDGGPLPVYYCLNKNCIMYCTILFLPKLNQVEPESPTEWFQRIMSD